MWIILDRFPPYSALCLQQVRVSSGCHETNGYSQSALSWQLAGLSLSLLFEAFKWLSFKYHSKSLWSILGQSQYLTFPKHTDWVRKRWMCSYWWSEVKSLSCIRLFATPWTVAYHAPPSMGFSRQEYWSRLSFPSSEDLPNSGIKPGSPGL